MSKAAFARKAASGLSDEEWERAEFTRLLDEGKPLSARQRNLVDAYIRHAIQNGDKIPSDLLRAKEHDRERIGASIAAGRRLTRREFDRVRKGEPVITRTAELSSRENPLLTAGMTALVRERLDDLDALPRFNDKPKRQTTEDIDPFEELNALPNVVRGGEIPDYPEPTKRDKSGKLRY